MLCRPLAWQCETSHILWIWQSLHASRPRAAHEPHVRRCRLYIHIVSFQLHLPATHVRAVCNGCVRIRILRVALHPASSSSRSIRSCIDDLLFEVMPPKATRSSCQSCKSDAWTCLMTEQFIHEGSHSSCVGTSETRRQQMQMQ